MDANEIVRLCQEHTLYTWKATASHNAIPIVRADGVYLYDADGKKIIDFNSQLMSVNVGHNHPKVKQAIKDQVDKLAFVAPPFATEVRARLGQKLAELAPGDLNTFFFTNAGAEANENAIRAARHYTGRQKIISRYRSYHGATNLTMSLTGDPRRWPNEPGPPGHVHVMDPYPYHYSFGETEEEITAKNLQYLEEVIMYEGPQNIAAMIVESITGTNGVLIPPKGYLKGLRALLDKYDILMICDEVMAGFGRSGKLFAFMHDDIVPDLVCMAKGLTSSYLPLGAVGMRDKIADYFRENVFPGGLTYNSHPMGCAAALANIEVLLEEKLIENAARLEPVMQSHMQKLKDKHPSFKAGRCKGLFGIIELQKNKAGDTMAPYNSSSPGMDAVAKSFREQGLFTFVRWFSFFTNPPLCVTEAQLDEGFAIIDSALDEADKFFEG